MAAKLFPCSDKYFRDLLIEAKVRNGAVVSLLYAAEKACTPGYKNARAYFALDNKSRSSDTFPCERSKYLFVAVRIKYLINTSEKTI